MSMRCELTLIPARACGEIRRLFNTVEGQEELIARWPRPEPARPGIARRILSVFWSPEEEEDNLRPPETFFNEQYEALLAAEDGSETFTDIGEDWHLLHFLLCGEFAECDSPLGFLMDPAEDIDDTSNGNGPHRLFTPEKAKHVSEALEKLTVEVMFRHWREKGSRASREIYRGDYLTENSPDSAEVREDWSGLLGALRDFFRKASETGAAIVVDIH
jgi:hypothetical protein